METCEPKRERSSGTVVHPHPQPQRCTCVISINPPLRRARAPRPALHCTAPPPTQPRPVASAWQLAPTRTGACIRTALPSPPLRLALSHMPVGSSAVPRTTTASLCHPRPVSHASPPILPGLIHRSIDARATTVVNVRAYIFRGLLAARAHRVAPCSRQRALG
jgi:hypothetical protein